MSAGPIGVFGAGGFVGSALCERLHAARQDVVAFVHSPGNAARVARLAVPIRPVDLLDRAAVDRAVAECGVVVNCALGTPAAMIQGLANLVAALRRRRVRLVHLRSLLIYGDDPGPDSATEEGRPAPGGNAYARRKLRQDAMVLALHRAGVPVYILCPGNVVGPYSRFSRGLVERLLQGPIPLVDDGRHPSNLTHVDNLVEAILVAARASGGAGERYFVNETRAVSWREVFDDLARVLGIPWSAVPVTRDQVVRVLRTRGRPETRGARLVALGARALAVPRLDGLARAVFRTLPARIQAAIGGPSAAPGGEGPSSGPALGDRYVTVQVRRAYHSPQKLVSRLGWRPPLDYERGVETTAAWMRFARVVGA